MLRSTWFSALVTWFVPGFGHARASRTKEAYGWAGAGVAAVLALFLTPWAVFASVLVHLVSALDVLVRVRPGRITPHNRTLAAFVVGIAVVPAVIAPLSFEAFKAPSSSMHPTLQMGDYIYVEKLTKRFSSIGRGDLIVFEQPCVRMNYIKRVVAVAYDTVEIRCNVLYINGKQVPTKLVQGAGCVDRDRDYDTQRSYERPCSRYRETLDGTTYDILDDEHRPAREQRGEVRDDHAGKDFPRLDGILPTCEMQPGDSRQARGTLVETKRDAAACEQQLHFVVPKDSLFVLGDSRDNSNDSRYWGVVPVTNVVGRVTSVWWPLDRIGRVD